MEIEFLPKPSGKVRNKIVAVNATTANAGTKISVVLDPVDFGSEKDFLNKEMCADVQ